MVTEALFEALGNVLTLQHFTYLMIGVLVGLVVGNLPGLGGIVGILLRRFGWPRPAFLIGFVLATQGERYLYQALQFSGWSFFGRPIVIIIGQIITLSVWLPCILMRGGTSKGPYLVTSDLPSDPQARDRVLLAVMGSPDLRQIDGIGGADTLTSKVAMVQPSARDDADVDYLFAQVSITDAFVDTAPSCGNIPAGVGPFAIERGMVPVTGSETVVTIYNSNTGSRIQAVVQTDGEGVICAGDKAIDGVPGAAAPVRLIFMDIVGSKTGGLLPTGKLIAIVEGGRGDADRCGRADDDLSRHRSGQDRI